MFNNVIMFKNGLVWMEDFSSDMYLPRLAVVGCGGQGTNLVNRLYRSGIKSATTIACNTDAKHLQIIEAHKKLLIGKALTKGLGAGGFPEIGAKAAEQSKEEIRAAITGNNMVFIAAGMGGGTGGGSAPIVADIAKEEGMLVVAFVTYPFSLERSRKNKADWSIAQLTKAADTTIIIENDKILKYAPNLPMDKAFELIDSIACNAVRGIADTITLPSLINLDFADVRSIMGNAGTAVINIGVGSGSDKVEKAISSTVGHPLMDVDLTGAKKAMIHVSGGTGLTIDEATRIGGGVTEGMADDANVIFGARLDADRKDEIRVMSIVTGVKPKFGMKAPLDATPMAERSFVAGIENF